MTVFKAFLKVLNKNKFVIIMYTVILLIFGGMNLESNETTTSFIANKPDLYIVNKDENVGITKSLVNYLSKNCNLIELDGNEDDALFYRDVNYILYIPAHFREDFLAKENLALEIKSTGDYQASLASMLLERYMEVAHMYHATIDNEEEIIQHVETTLSKNAKVEITSKLDTNSLSKVATFYNFVNYSLLAGCVYVICFILSSFKEKKILKRTVASSMAYKKYNRYLLLSNVLFAFIMWFLYVLLSFVLLGKIMFTMQGVLYIFNAFIFMICATAIAFLLANLFHNKNAINGLVNVIALGSSFLCGAFVPVEWLPDFVLKIAHILPSYYYIDTNNRIMHLEKFELAFLKPVLFNIFVLIFFTVLFVILTNWVSKKSRKIA